MKFDEAQVKVLNDRIWKRFSEGSDGLTLHEMAKVRLQHYHNDPVVDPAMIPGFEGHARQTSIVVDTATELRARLVENKFRPQVTAKVPSAKMDRTAEYAEMGLISMFDDFRSRTGVDVQGGLADGLMVPGYGVLMAYLDDKEYAAAGADYDDESDEERDGYTEDEYPEESGKTKAKKYRESDDAYSKRRVESRKGKRQPWMFKILPLREFAFVEVDSPMAQFKYGLRRWQQPLVDWFEDWQPNDWGEEPERSTGAYVEEGGWTPTYSIFEKAVTISQLWDKDWVYECIEGLPDEAGTKYRFRRTKNRMKQVPFFICAGRFTTDPNPALAYEPALVSTLRFKPHYDRYISNMSALAESMAIPRYVLEQIDKDAYASLTDEEGHQKIFSQNAMEANKAPDGYHYVRLAGDALGRDYIALAEMYKEELLRSLPATGKVTLGASTQSWTARMTIQQENIEPGMYLANMSWALEQVVRMVVAVNGDEVDGPGEIVFAPRSGGKAPEMVVIKPEDWRGLDVHVAIEGESAMEKTAKVQQGSELLAAGNITRLEFRRDWMNMPNAEDSLAEADVQQYFDDNIKPGLLKEAFAAAYGSRFSLQPVDKGSQTPFVDVSGAGLTTQGALQSMGAAPVGAPPATGMGGNGTMPQAVMPPLVNPAGAPVPGLTMGPGVPG